MENIQNVKIEDLLPPEQLWEYNKYMEYNDNNINGFGLPITLELDNEYRKKLEEVLNSYYKYISKKQAFNSDNELLLEISKNNSSVLKAIDEYLYGDIQSAQQSIFDIIKPYCDNEFIVSELDKSYAFRGIAPFTDLHSQNNDYKSLMETELCFFRARKSNVTLSSIRDLSYIPLKKREIVSTGRFSIAGIPCLYLGTTSYCCWLELDRPSQNEFYCSSVKLNDTGKKLKVLNLVISEGLINGIFNRPVDKDNSIQHKMQRTMMMFFPLVIATAFHIKHEKREFKSEYIVSQLIMQCLYRLNIDGIAYLSKKSYSDYEYPHNVNLAIPVHNINVANINNIFSISSPVSLELYSMINNETYINDNKSYINKNFNEGFNGQINPNNSIPYKSIIFSTFDDYLINQNHEKVIKQK